MTKIKIKQKRSPKASDRKEAGHWETDLMLGGKQYILTVADRKTLMTYIAWLPAKTADNVAAALIHLLKNEELQTIVSDRGSEFTRWRKVEKALGIKWYVCAPRRPDQRPVIENINGFLRRWLPRNIPAEKLTPRYVKWVQRQANNFPRPTYQIQNRQTNAPKRDTIPLVLSHFGVDFTFPRRRESHMP